MLIQIGMWCLLNRPIHYALILVVIRCFPALKYSIIIFVHQNLMIVLKVTDCF